MLYTPSDQKFYEGLVDHMQAFTDAAENMLAALTALRQVSRQRMRSPNEWSTDHLHALTAHVARWERLEEAITSELAMVQVLGGTQR